MKKLLLLCGLLPLFASAQFKYPVTPKGNTTDNYHGTVVADPYRWLENDRSDSTKDWVTRQNKVTFNYLESIPYRKQWQERLEEMNNYAKYSSPFREGTDYSFTRMTDCKTRVYCTGRKA